MALSDCCLMTLPKIEDSRGNLTFIESGRHIPFDFKRIYYLYDIPGGAERGGHAHSALKQFIVPMSGSFDIFLDDGTDSRSFHMNRSYYGLYIAPRIWREIRNFSSGAVLLVLASEFYDEADYFRSYPAFLEAVKATQK